MDLSQFFSQSVLEQAKELFDADAVLENIVIRGNAFICSVNDEGKDYKVKIFLEPKTRMRISCECLDAQNGFACKHMGAGLMMLNSIYPEWRNGLDEKRKQIDLSRFQKEPVEEALEVTPEKDGFSIPYSHYDVNRIFRNRYKIMAARLKEAEQIIKDNQVETDITPDPYSLDPDQVIMKVIFPTEAHYTAVTMIANLTDLTHIDCTNPMCSIYPCVDAKDGNTLCVHQVVGMRLFKEYLERKEDPIANDDPAKLLIERYEHIPALVQKSLGRMLQVIPFISRKDNTYMLSIECGEDKKYLIRKLKAFITTIRNKESYRISTKNHFNFLTDKFYPYSQAIIELLDQAFCEMEDPYHGDDLRDGESIRLTPLLLDMFFELSLGHTVRICDVERTVEDGQPQIHLDLYPKTDDKKRITGIALEGTLPEKINGAKFVYFPRGAKLIRVPRKEVNAYLALYDNAKNGKYALSVTRSQIAPFYRRVLPQLVKEFDITDYAQESVQNFIPAVGKATFFLDYNEDLEAILLNAKIKYGELEYELMEEDAHSSVRNGMDEAFLREAVYKWFPKYDEASHTAFRYDEETSIFPFLKYGLDELMVLGETKGSADFRKLKIKRKWGFDVDISLDGNLLNLSLLSKDFTMEEFSEILAAYQKRKDYHLLKNGTFVDLTENYNVILEFLETANVSIQDFVKGKMHLPAYRALYLDQMLSAHSELNVDRSQAFVGLLDAYDTARKIEFAVPESLKDVMRNYQVEGFMWIKRLFMSGFNGILADDMGLGKTLQVLSVLLYDKENNCSNQPSLIVCPTSLVYNWAGEIRKFAPALSAKVIVGQREKRLEIINSMDADVYITSYDLLKRDIDSYDGKTYWIMVLDEAQYIKNRGSIAAKAVKIVSATHRLALTGTPIENRLGELWSIFDFLMPGFLFDYERFYREIEYPATRHEDDIHLQRLRQMVGPFVLRRLKTDVLEDLPEKTEQVRYITLEGEQRKLYDAQESKIRYVLNKEKDYKSIRFKVLSEITKLRQLCCDPSLIYDDYHGPSAKRTELIEFLKEIIDAGHKVLVFSQFVSMMKLIEDDLKKEGIAYYHLSGETSKEDRLVMVDQFNTDTTPVFMISLKAGGTGLNLIGADIVVHYDPWWNVAVMNQATDRAHRIGQVNPVTVFPLIAKNTIEERILHLQEAKKELAESILSGDQINFAALDKEELAQLLLSAPENGE